jgi:sulfur relay (sulfurtransferase) DsrC/TusE family protein
MNNSSSRSSTPTSSKLTHAYNKNKDAVNDTIAINEKINLTKKQYEVLNMICNSYEKSISEYMQEALVRSMQSDIEYGDLCDVLLDKLDEDDKKKKNNSSSSPAPNAINNDLDMLEKLQTQSAIVT